MNFSIHNGFLSPAIQIASPNYNARPTNKIHAIIIHNISLPPNEYGKTDPYGNHYVTALFTNSLNPNEHPYFQSIAKLQVSAHLFIQTDGSVIQYVNFNHRAWHAGQSHYLGQANCNDYSIGIELEGSDHHDFTDKQYEILAKIIHVIYQHYPDTHAHLAGHSDIAPKRKTDPGPFFDWQRLRLLIDNAQKNQK